MRRIDTDTHADDNHVEDTLRDWLITLEQETFDRAVQDTAAEAALEVAEISHRHHPRADIHIRIPEHIGRDLWRVRATLLRAFRLSGWPVEGKNLTIRCRRGALLARCWPKWDV